MRRTTRRTPVWGLVLLLAAGCASGTDPVEVPPSQALASGPVEVTLAPGEEARLGGGVVRVRFLRVVEDGRCPVDVTCVWEGNAVVEVSLGVGSGPDALLQLNSALDPRSVRWSGVEVTFLHLEPLPRSDRPTPPAEYRLRVELRATS